MRPQCRIDWIGNPEETDRNPKLLYYRYVRAFDGHLVPIDTV